MRHNMEAEQLDGSDYMEALQLSADGCSDRNTDVDVEQLSASVSHLTMQSKEQQQQLSICISSTTEEEEDADDDASCITISDTSEDEDQQQPDPEPDSMAVSERQAEQEPQQPQPILTSDKVERIEAFLRDIERHGGDNTPPSSLNSTSASARRRSQIALADTESMTRPNTEEDWQPAAAAGALNPRPIDSSKRLSGDDTVLDMDSSKRLADDATGANTLSSLEPESPELKSISQRLASNDTELSTECSNSTLQEEEEDEPIPEESIEIPETGSEGEASPPRRSSSSSSSGDYEYEQPSVQL
ncbi:hypothetical protein KR032_010718 [Drosophila birchii]|nr:hypothetical protein KR032_010718 [Drosophila birchii]